MNKSVIGTHDCFGCGVCSVACKKNLIDLTVNKDGFYEPIVNIENCTGCGLCSEICSFKHDDDSFRPVISSYGAWSEDPSVRQSCSSGGVSYDISRYLLGKGYKVCSVRYNAETNRAEHYISYTADDLNESKGSKYIQSYPVDAFKCIDLNEKYLVVGTPCMISSLRRAIKKFRREDNFILIDFFCHGIPSKLMWDKYIRYISKDVGRIQSVSWRNKFSGWHNSWALKITGEKKEITSYWTNGDKFFNLFLSDSCLNKACYDNCRFKYDNSLADIRIGDAWGKCYQDDEKGVSIAVSYTDRGDAILHECGCHLEPRPLEELAEQQMKVCPQRPGSYDKIIKLLHRDDSTITRLYRIIQQRKKREKLRRRMRRIFHVVANAMLKIIR